MAIRVYEASLSIQATREFLYSKREQLPVFTVYDHPTDFPDFYVARLWLSLPAAQALPMAFMDPSLERIQTTLEALGLVKLMRQEGDDPSILETWI